MSNSRTWLSVWSSGFAKLPQLWMFLGKVNIYSNMDARRNNTQTFGTVLNVTLLQEKKNTYHWCDRLWRKVKGKVKSWAKTHTVALNEWNFKWEDWDGNPVLDFTLWEIKIREWFPVVCHHHRCQEAPELLPAMSTSPIPWWEVGEELSPQQATLPSTCGWGRPRVPSAGASNDEGQGKSLAPKL